MRYRLRTLMFILALGPPVLAEAWDHYRRWSFERQLLAVQAKLDLSLMDFGGTTVVVSDEDWERLIHRGRPVCRLIDLGSQIPPADEP